MTESFVYYFTSGLNRYKAEEWNLAVADFKKALNADPDAAREQNIHFYLGVALKKMGPDHFKESVKFLNKSVKNWPDEPEHYFHLGYIHWKQFEIESGAFFVQGQHKGYYNQHVYHPDAATIFNGNLIRNDLLNLLKKSISFYRKAIERDKKNPLYCHNLAIALYYQDPIDFTKLFEILLQSKKISLDEGTKNLPIILTTDREWAILIVQEFPDNKTRSKILRSLFGFIFDTDKENPESWFNMCLALEEAGENEEAIDILQKAIIQFPDQSEFRYRLARVMAKDGMFEEAISEFKKILTYNNETREDNYQSAYAWLIDIFTERGDYKQALNYWVERGPLWDDYSGQYGLDPDDYHQFLVKLKNFFDKSDSEPQNKPIPDLDLFIRCREVENKIRTFIRCVMPDESEWWDKISDKEFKKRVEDQINTYKAQQFFKNPHEEISKLDWFSLADYPRIFNKNWPRFSIFITEKKFHCNIDALRDYFQKEIIETSLFRNDFAHLRPISDIGRMKATAAVMGLDVFLSKMVGE